MQHKTSDKHNKLFSVYWSSFCSFN